MRTIAIFVFALLIATGPRVLGQSNTANNFFKVYKEVIDFLKKGSNSRYDIYIRTNKYYLKFFEFKDPSGVDSNPDRIWKKPEWKHFLSSVDTATLSNYSLSSEGKPWFKKTNVSKKLYNRIEFAPLIISKDNDKALCILSLSRLGSESFQAYYLERENNNWKVKYGQTMVYVD